VGKTQPVSKSPNAPLRILGVTIRRPGLVLALLAAAFYLPTVTFDYTQDDAIVITDNMYTTQGLSGIAGLFGHDTFYGYFKDESKLRLVSGGRYRPLTPAMFAIEYALVGKHPWLSHLVNALLYGLLAWVLFLFLQQLLSARMNASPAGLAAFLATLVFALHPIHTEAVANIKGRDEIVAALGAITGLWLTLRGQKDSGYKLALLAGGAFFLGMLSKENVVTMLGVVPLTLLWFRRDGKIRWLAGMAPIAAAAVVFLFLRGSVTGWSAGETPTELLNNPFIKLADNQYVPFSATEKSATIVYTMGKYVQLLLFPYPLTHDYYPRHIEIQDWGKPLVLASLLAWLGLLFVVIRGWRTRNWWAYGILFYVLTMSVTSNILFPVGTNMSERFAFLPSVGFAVIAGVALARWMESAYKAIAGPACLAVFILLGGWTLVRSQVWKDNTTLFTTDIHTSQRSAKLLNAVGGDLITRAEIEQDPARRHAMLTEAQDYLKRAQAIHPNYKLSYLLLGNSAFHLGHLEEAIAYYRHVLKLDPNYREGQRNLGVALRDFGKQQGEQHGNLGAALSLLEEAVTYLPDDYQTYHLLGVAHGQKGEPARAAEFFRKEIELAPKNAAGHFNLGIALRQLGDEDGAQQAFEQARAIDPNLPQLQGK